MKTEYISLGPFLIFALLVYLIEATRESRLKVVKVHTLASEHITFIEGDSDEFINTTGESL